ncbi:hypothetical protein [Rossellomorea arthrocnemi]|uniref:hypothetical protein n=1 Tax=Rossellomorea arthrocnemi TaxID=2769542 RepID=UPI00191B67B8|nr:hypothetical protein [Rossellomorea arthrocnemi]
MEPLIIAILIGLITTIFNKVKESPSNKPVRQKPIQTATPASPQPDRRGREAGGRERTRRREPRSNKDPVKESALSIQTRIGDNKREPESAYSSLQKQEERYSRKVEANHNRARKIREASHPLTIDFKNEDDIVKGFIFSEVFGPPRSKKRHHQK